MIPLPREPFNYRLGLLVLMASGAIWAAFFAQQAEQQDADYALTMSVGLPLAVWAFGVMVYMGYVFASSLILRDAPGSLMKFNKILPVVCITLIGIAGFELLGNAKSITTTHTVMNAVGEVVECVSTEYLSNDYGPRE